VIIFLPAQTERGRIFSISFHHWKILFWRFK